MYTKRQKKKKQPTVGKDRASIGTRYSRNFGIISPFKTTLMNMLRSHMDKRAHKNRWERKQMSNVKQRDGNPKG